MGVIFIIYSRVGLLDMPGDSVSSALRDSSFLPDCLLGAFISDLVVLGQGRRTAAECADFSWFHNAKGGQINQRGIRGIKRLEFVFRG